MLGCALAASADAGIGARRGSPRRGRLVPLDLAVIVAMLWAAPGTAEAAVYYVDGASPACSNSGPGTSATPYCTISAAASARGGPGTTLFVRPAVYREQVTVPASGTSSSPFVFQALGSPVVVDGADDFSSTSQWIPFSGNVYRASSVTWSPVQVFLDGARLVPSASPQASLPAGSFKHVAGEGLYANVGGGNPGLRETLVGRRQYGFRLSGRSSVTIDGFTVVRQEDRSFYLSGGSDGCRITNSVAAQAAKSGIAVSGSASAVIGSNTAYDNGDHGIYLLSGATGARVEDNESFSNARPLERAANGIRLSGAAGNLIQRNWLHHNQDSGSSLSSGSDNNTFLQNVSWDNGDHGFDFLGSRNNVLVGNVAWNNLKDGFSFEGLSPGNRLYNTIAVNNGLTTGEFNLWVDADSTAGFDSDYNIFWNSTGQRPIKYISSEYATVLAFTMATGHDAHSSQANPRFTDPAAGNFQPLSGSPAIDSADSSVPSWPSTDAEGRPRVDDPASPNLGAGTILYADRGALEFQPSGLPPVATLAVSPTSGSAPLSVTASASGSVDPDGGAIVSYRFDFGDGGIVGPQPSQTATHVYGEGSWTATVTVTDDEGDTDMATAQVTVLDPTEPQPPIASLVVTPSSGKQPLSVTANASGSSDTDGVIVSYRFNFGDGTIVGPQPGATATHVYQQGSWTATVTVTDDDGLISSASQAVTVGPPNQPPTASLTASPTSGKAPLTVTASATGSGDPDGVIVSYRFNFGDGTIVGPQPGTSATHSYGQGEWTVTVTVTDDNGATATASRAVSVGPPNQPPTAVLTVTPSSGKEPVAVTASASGSGDSDGTIVSYRFDFGDGTIVGPQPGPTASHVYNAGAWTARVTVTDSDGATATATAPVSITPNLAPHGVIDTPAGTITIIIGAAVNFTGTGTDPDGDLPLTYRWTFGGGIPASTVEDPGPVVFTKQGNYTVTFSVTDSRGRADPTPASVLVRVRRH